MSMDVRKVKLDFNRTFQSDIPSVQGDSGRAIEFKIMNGSLPVDITGETIKIFGLKPDGFRVFNNATITDAANGKCTVDLTLQMLCIAGTVQCTLVRYKNNQKLSSRKFNIDVAESVADDIEIESTNEYLALTDALNITKDSLDTKVTEVIDKMLADGNLANMTIEDNSITPKKTTFIKVVENLFDGQSTSGLVSNASGSIENHVHYYHTDYIKIKGDYLTLVGFKFPHFAFYDENKVFINNPKATENPVAIPSNAVYIRLTLPTQDTKCALYLGTEAKEGCTLDDSVELPLVTPEKTTFIGKIRNLFDKDNTGIKNGYYMDEFGTETVNDKYFITHFIPVKPNTTYTATNARFVTYFNGTSVLSGSGMVNSSASQLTFTTSSSTTQIKVTGLADTKDTYMVVESNVLPSYLPYGEETTIIDNNIKAPHIVQEAVDAMNKQQIETSFDIWLPKDIYIALGRTIEIYNSEVFWGFNPNNYFFQWKGCGQCLKRKWRMTATDIGTATLTLIIRDMKNNIVTQTSSTVHVVSNIIDKQVKLLPIGDSLTMGKAWLSELTNLSPNITTVGTVWGKYTEMGIDLDPNLYPHCEGRSGYVPQQYLSDLGNGNWGKNGEFGIDGRGNRNPFWNPNTKDFDLHYYETNWNKEFNAIQIYLGRNDYRTAVSGITTMINKIRVTHPTIPIFVCSVIFGGDQNGVGHQQTTDNFAGTTTYKLNEDRIWYNLQKKYEEVFSKLDNVFYVPLACCHDSEFNFPTENVGVNPRNTTVTEDVAIESVHPSECGFLQMADVMFSTIAGHIDSIK